LLLSPLLLSPFSKQADDDGNLLRWEFASGFVRTQVLKQLKSQGAKDIQHFIKWSTGVRNLAGLRSMFFQSEQYDQTCSGGKFEMRDLMHPDSYNSTFEIDLPTSQEVRFSKLEPSLFIPGQYLIPEGSTFEVADSIAVLGRSDDWPGSMVDHAVFPEQALTEAASNVTAAAKAAAEAQTVQLEASPSPEPQDDNCESSDSCDSDLITRANQPAPDRKKEGGRPSQATGTDSGSPPPQQIASTATATKKRGRPPKQRDIVNAIVPSPSTAKLAVDVDVLLLQSTTSLAHPISVEGLNKLYAAFPQGVRVLGIFFTVPAENFPRFTKPQKFKYSDGSTVPPSIRQYSLKIPIEGYGDEVISSIPADDVLDFV
jgi:hypothetical protein